MKNVKCSVYSFNRDYSSRQVCIYVLPHIRSLVWNRVSCGISTEVRSKVIEHIRFICWEVIE